MTMFAKKDTVTEEFNKAESEAVSSIIDKSMVVTGEITFQGKTKIDGTVTGNINGEHLIVSATGKITGDVTVSSFNCFGVLNGNVKANIVTARKDCSIHGRIVAGSLTVEPGAVLDGEIKAALKDHHYQQTAGKDQPKAEPAAATTASK